MAKLYDKYDPATGKRYRGAIQAEELPEGTIDKHYTHNQSVPSDTWTVVHNMGKRPAVSIEDSAGTQILGYDRTDIDDNTLILSFSAAFGGKVYCN